MLSRSLRSLDYELNRFYIASVKSCIRHCSVKCRLWVKRARRSEMKGSRATLESTGKPNSDDEASLNEYSVDVDFGKFNEEGSFVGQYATNAATTQ